VRIVAHDEDSMTNLFFSEVHRHGKLEDFLALTAWRSGSSMPFDVANAELHQQVNFSEFGRPDVMVFMSEEALKRLLSEADPERTLVVYDDTLIKSVPAPYTKIFAVPATGQAEKEFKNRMVANIFMLGAVIELINPGSFDVLKRIVASSVPKKFEELNIKALDAGYEYYRTHKPQ